MSDRQKFINIVKEVCSDDDPNWMTGPFLFWLSCQDFHDIATNGDAMVDAFLSEYSQ